MMYINECGDFMEKNRVNVFISYSHKDMEIKKKLCKQLETLKTNSIIDYWSDAEIPAGGDIDDSISEQIKKADVFILLISPDFLTSCYCIEKETKVAIARHNKGEAIVVPCICRECVSLDDYEFSSLKRVPADGRPITNFKPHEKGCVEAVKLIKDMITTVFPKKNSSTSSKENNKNDNKTKKKNNLKSEVSSQLKTKSTSRSSSNRKRSETIDVNKISVVLYNEGVLGTVKISKSDIAKLPAFYKDLSDLNNHLKNYTKDGVSTYKKLINSKKMKNAEAICFRLYLMELCTAIRRYITDSAGVRVHFRGDDGINYVGIIASSPTDGDDDKVNWNTRLTPIPQTEGLIFHSLRLNAPLLKSLNKSLNFVGNNDALWPEYYTEALTLDNGVVLSLGISFDKEQFKQKEYLMYFFTMTRFGDLIKCHIENYVEQCKKINDLYNFKSTVDALLMMGD